MASCPYASTPETTNRIRTSRVLLGPCTDQLRDVLRHYVPPTNFRYVLQQNRHKLPKLTSPQRDLILPRLGHYSGDYSDMDVSLLYLLLRNICNIPPHTNGWGNSPDVSDISLSANIDRLREARNRLGHSSNTGLSQNEFRALWSDIKGTVHTIDTFLNNGFIYERAVDYLSTETMDPEQELYIEQLRKQLQEEETTKERVTKLEEHVNSNVRMISKQLVNQVKEDATTKEKVTKLEDRVNSNVRMISKQVVNQVKEDAITKERVTKLEERVSDIQEKMQKLEQTPRMQQDRRTGRDFESTYNVQMTEITRHRESQATLGQLDKTHVGKNVGDVKVDVVRGSLVQRKVDVLVNVTNARIALERGTLSKALLEATGEDLQRECSTRFPNGLQIGDVESTSAYNLRNVKAIFHTTLPIYNGHSSQEMILYLVVQRCLAKATEEKYCSIGFPCIGTRYQAYPPDLAAKTVMSAIRQYVDVNIEGSLRRIEFVVYEGGKDWREVWETFCTHLNNI